MHLTQEAEIFIQEIQSELQQLIRDLCAIPAPSHHEEKRAAFCLDWFKNCGAADAYIDDALNVICPWGVTDSNDLVVFMAHTDTVFPDLDPLPFAEHDGRMFSPGVTDDTANLAVLMVCARHLMQGNILPKTGILFVANSCEEGLGNLKGTRALMDAYGPRIRELITLDGTNLAAVVTQAVGSHRYRVSVRTAGGHSFGNFGNANAIYCLSSIINDLYCVQVPVEGNSKTTYNVGLISGGTSVNTIAQHAEMLYEYRSDNLNCLQQMEKMFAYIIEKHRCRGTDVSVEKIGDRPCSGNVAPELHQALIERISASIRNTLSLEPVFSSGSTDANVPLSMGIPAICISVCNGGKCHTREEWLDIASLKNGCRLMMDFMQYYLVV